MGLPPPFSKGDTPYGRGYHNAENRLLPDAEAIVEETQEIPAQARKRQSARGGRPRASERAVADAQIGTCFGQDANGRLSIAIGSGSPQASSTSVSRGGEGRAYSRSSGGGWSSTMPGSAAGSAG